MKFTKLTLLGITAIGFVACTPMPPAIVDLETDKVIVQQNYGNTDIEVDRVASEGCKIHKRKAKSISTTCLDEYCIRQHVLFACV